MKRNIEKIVEETRGTINKRYDISIDECMFLTKTKVGFDLLNASFTFGYAQGMKAAKAEIKNKGVI